jgi:hypothetical protein
MNETGPPAARVEKPSVRSAGGARSAGRIRTRETGYVLVPAPLVRPGTGSPSKADTADPSAIPREHVSATGSARILGGSSPS